MLTRQKALIRLIANEGGSIGKTRLQKLAFSLREAVDGSPTSKVYQFIPYHFGPYSFTLTHELAKLEAEGIVRISESEITLSDLVPNLILEPALRTSIDFVSRKYANVKTDVLVKTVYARNPWYTSKARDKAKRVQDAPSVNLAIFTVGYEGLMLEGLLDLLLRNGIKRLIDVRANPVARQFGFHRSTLQRHCRDIDIEYTHIPELGITSEDRSGLDGQRSYDLLFSKYARETLISQDLVVDLVGSMLAEKPSALMCMEADCSCCHRTTLARALQQKIGLPIQELRLV